jgi:Mg/Co/Ni transporter MgtE
MSVFVLMVQLTGFYLIYNTSARAVLRKDPFSVWLQRWRKTSLVTGFVLLIISFVVSITGQGVGTGALTGCIMLMTIASLIIIITPLTLNEN